MRPSNHPEEGRGLVASSLSLASVSRGVICQSHLLSSNQTNLYQSLSLKPPPITNAKHLWTNCTIWASCLDWNFLESSETTRQQIWTYYDDDGENIDDMSLSIFFFFFFFWGGGRILWFRWLVYGDDDNSNVWRLIFIKQQCGQINHHVVDLHKCYNAMRCHYCIYSAYSRFLPKLTKLANPSFSAFFCVLAYRSFGVKECWIEIQIRLQLIISINHFFHWNCKLCS